MTGACGQCGAHLEAGTQFCQDCGCSVAAGGAGRLAVAGLSGASAGGPPVEARAAVSGAGVGASAAMFTAPASGAIQMAGKTRNPWGVWLLSVVTFGIYGLWWYYTINAELRDYHEQIRVQPGLSLMAVLFGYFTLEIATVVSWVRTGGRICQAQQLAGSRARCSGGIGFLLVLVGFAAVYYQSQLNKVWDACGNPPPGTVLSRSERRM